MVDVSVEECSKLIGQYEATDQGKVEGLMSIDGENSEELEKTKNFLLEDNQPPI